MHQHSRNWPESHIYHLWHENPEKGFSILDAISQEIVAAGAIPDTRALESCMGVSLMILFWHYKDLDKRQAHFGRLQQIWKVPIEHMLFLRESDGRVAVQLKRVVREAILRLFTRLAMRMAGKAEEASVMFSLRELRAFFPPTEQRKRLFAKLVPHMDATHGGCSSISTIEADLIEVLQDRDLLTSYVPFLAIVSHAIMVPEITLEILKQLFQIAMDTPPPPVVKGASPAGPMVQILVWGVRNMTYGNRFAGSDLTSIQIPRDALETMGGSLGPSRSVTIADAARCAANISSTRSVRTPTSIIGRMKMRNPIYSTTCWTRPSRSGMSTPSCTTRPQCQVLAPIRRGRYQELPCKPSI